MGRDRFHPAPKATPKLPTASALLGAWLAEFSAWLAERRPALTIRNCESPAPFDA